MEVDLPCLEPNTAGGPRSDAVCFTNEASEARLRALVRWTKGQCVSSEFSLILKPKILFRIS
jgi:hypothetical protein